jgi:hypothetical protein
LAAVARRWLAACERIALELASGKETRQETDRTA